MVLFSPRTSPSGQEAPVAVLSLSAPVAFTAGTQLAIPFDTVSFIKGDAGKLIHPPTDGLSFSGGPGLWVAHCQLSLSVSVNSIQCIVAGTTGTQQVNAVTDIADTGALGEASFMGHFFLPATDDPLTDDFFAAFGASIKAAGASGNVLAGASLLLYPMYGFDR